MTGKYRSARSILAGLTVAFALGACDSATPDAESTMDADAVPATGETAEAVTTAEAAALVYPNEASEAYLRALGLDSAAVSAILEGRPYENMTALDERLPARMDSTARDDLYRRMFIPLDLNSASREEILLVPGVGERMAHEFEEYRPYRGIEQFRREIGKYVDEAEVARLERYVTIR